MNKKLPKFKKTLKSFILNEDAKVIDKTVTKIAITASFIAVNFITRIEDSHGGTRHKNYVYTSEDGLENDGDTEITETFSVSGKDDVVNVPAKAVASNHGNHYNHSKGGHGS